MQQQVFAVIGANWGDEGKGLITDFLCKENDHCVVVRHNGGGQAGHTVEHEEGRRHVFNHIGSGTFRDAETYLSEYFCANPRIFLNEIKRLAGCAPRVTIHPEAMVTTPFDVLINQFRESKRGGLRHGSCGCGVGETVDRHEKQVGLATRVAEMHSMSDGSLHAHLMDVSAYMVRVIGSSNAPSKDEIDTMALRFIADFREFMTKVKIADNQFLKSFETVIFEGAQGLGLCQSNTDQMPYLTRSFTGTQNVAKICRSAGLGRFDVVYISRWYATRHGAGPLEYELDFNPSGITDNTNISNDWQGKLRYGLLDVNALTERIDRDWREGIRQRHLAITHLDCCASGMGYIFAKDGKIRQGQGELLNAIRQITGPVWRSNGKFAANVCLPY